MILAISLTTLLLSQTPHVELDFNSLGCGDWKGKRFNEIVPARTIKRVVRLTESGFARPAGRPGEQADYDALLAHLLASTAAATDAILADNESKLAELLVVTSEGEILSIEIVGTPDAPSSPTAILVRGKGHGARVQVNDFKHPDDKT